MIDPNWQVVDLDPVTWRELGRFFDPGQYIRASQPGERGLFVLHDHGTVLRIVDTQTGVRRDLALEIVSDPQTCARELYERGEWQRVHVINKAHLANVSRVAQSRPQRELTLDQYYYTIYRLLWDNPDGYVSVPPHPGHWHGWTYKQISDSLEQIEFSPASLALGVLAHGRWQIGLVLVWESEQIRKVTTFEVFPQALPAEVSQETLETLSRYVTETLAPAAGLLICTQEVFNAWIESETKQQTLQAAHQAGQAYWRWQVRTAV